MNVASKMTSNAGTAQNGQGQKYNFPINLKFRQPSFHPTLIPGQNIMVHPIQPQNLIVDRLPSNIVNYLPQ